MAGMRQDKAVDGFRLAYDRTGQGPAVLLLHGWPGDRTDYREVVPLVSASAEVIVPDLRGFGESDKHEADPATAYNAAAQARSILGLIEELELRRPVIAGYDVGSRIAQAIARERPDLVRALVVAPPLPGIGRRILDPQAQREFWYQSFHNLGLCPELIDGNSGPTGPGRATNRPAGTSIILFPSTGRRARSPPRSPGTGRAPARSRPRWRNRYPNRTGGSRCRRRCCGHQTIRCSRAHGPTGSTSSSRRPR